MTDELPDLGLVFWPVGTGDSSTIVVSDDVVLQLDLNDRDKADEDDTHEVPVVDLLVEALPEGEDGRPFLAAFMLTHADKDHCSGFDDLMDKATIGELWATPRMWREYLDDPEAPDLCDDAKAFHEEVKRRVDAVKAAVEDGREIALGDRVLVIGYDTDEKDHGYHDLPAEYLLKPGQSITKINGVDHEGRFEVFIHAPFKDDCASARNDTSLAVQVTLTEDGGQDGKVLLFGDLAYETIMKIFTYSEDHGREERLEWDLLLAPHHCSKKVMYVREGKADVLKIDILEKLEEHAREGSVVVASSAVIPETDTDGANPPHRMAADRYQEYADRFICTMEWPSVDDPSPVVLGIDENGAQIVEDTVVELSAKSADVAKASGRRRLSEVAAAASRAGVLAREAGLAAASAGTAGAGVATGTDRVRDAVRTDRGSQDAPTTTVGFGCA